MNSTLALVNKTNGNHSSEEMTEFFLYGARLPKAGRSLGSRARGRHGCLGEDAAV